MPFAIVAETPAEHALLAAARAGSVAGVAAALDAGARPDVVHDTAWHVENGEWDLQFATALVHAVQRDVRAMLDLLLRRGASLHTRRLPMLDAAGRGAPDTVRRLIAAGSRVNGWRDEREWPIHRLVARRARESPEGVARSRAALLELGTPPAEAARIVPDATDTPTLLAVLDALLEAGADPDAPWDNGLTMLMVGGEEAGARLLAHGADVRRRDAGGRTALHAAETAGKVRLLVAHRAEVDALSSPPPEEDGVTPLQAHLLRGRWTDREIVPTLLALGADPRARDGAGHNTLAYCRTVADFEAMRARGLDPAERMPDGGTLLHHLARSSGAVRGEELALLDHFLALGLDVNATDDAGRTVLHLVAAEELTTLEDVRALLARGADPAIRDRDGQRAHDRAPASRTEVRAVLR